jgi:hypothetical protein
VDLRRAAERLRQSENDLLAAKKTKAASAGPPVESLGSRVNLQRAAARLREAEVNLAREKTNLAARTSLPSTSGAQAVSHAPSSNSELTRTKNNVATLPKTALVSLLVDPSVDPSMKGTRPSHRAAPAPIAELEINRDWDSCDAPSVISSLPGGHYAAHPPPTIRSSRQLGVVPPHQLAGAFSARNCLPQSVEENPESRIMNATCQLAVSNTEEEGESSCAQIQAADNKSQSGLEQSNKSSYFPTRCHILVALFLAFLVLATITLVVAFAVPLSKGGASAPKTRMQALQEFKNSLPVFTQQALLDPSSPQAQALAFLVLEQDDDNSSIPEQWKLLQRFTLATIHMSLYHSFPDQALDDCDWFRADVNLRPACNYVTKHIQHLEIRLDRNASRIMPPELSFLQDLKSLTIHGTPDASSSLGDWLPTELGVLEHWTAVTIVGINLQGSIPIYITNFTNLEYIDWRDNKLTGGLPNDLSRLSNLNDLTLHKNPTLKGTLPSDWKGMTKLQKLWMDDCQLSGSIPDELAQQLSSLKYLSLRNNSLTGSIPSELGALSIEEFRVSHNLNLTGTIPSELGSWLTTLVFFEVQETSLGGSIPRDLCSPLSSKVDVEVNADCEKVECCESNPSFFN